MGFLESLGTRASWSPYPWRTDAVGQRQLLPLLPLTPGQTSRWRLVHHRLGAQPQGNPFTLDRSLIRALKKTPFITELVRGPSCRKISGVMKNHPLQWGDQTIQMYWLSLPKSSWFQKPPNHHEFDISGSKKMVKESLPSSWIHPHPSSHPARWGNLHMDRERPAAHFDPDPWSQPTRNFSAIKPAKHREIYKGL